MDLNECVTSISYSVCASIENLRDYACLKAIRNWAIDNEIDEVCIMDEEKLKEIIRLGSIEYQRIHGD